MGYFLANFAFYLQRLKYACGKGLKVRNLPFPLIPFTQEPLTLLFLTSPFCPFLTGDLPVAAAAAGNQKFMVRKHALKLCFAPVLRNGENSQGLGSDSDSTEGKTALRSETRREFPLPPKMQEP